MSSVTISFDDRPSLSLGTDWLIGRQSIRSPLQIAEEGFVCLLGAFIFRAVTENTEVAQRRTVSGLFAQSRTASAIAANARFIGQHLLRNHRLSFSFGKFLER